MPLRADDAWFGAGAAFCAAAVDAAAALGAAAAAAEGAAGALDGAGEGGCSRSGTAVGACRSAGVGVDIGCSATWRGVTAGSGWTTSIGVGVVRSCGAVLVTSGSFGASTRTGGGA